MTLDEARVRLSEAEIARAKAWGQFREYDDKARKAYINLLHVERGLRHAEQTQVDGEEGVTNEKDLSATECGN